MSCFLVKNWRKYRNNLYKMCFFAEKNVSLRLKINYSTQTYGLKQADKSQTGPNGPFI